MPTQGLTTPTPDSPAGATGQDKAAEPLDRVTLAIAAVVIIGALMSILDATVVNVALHTLGRDLHSSLSTIQWVISGYTLALASVIPVSGWLADRSAPDRCGLQPSWSSPAAHCSPAWPGKPDR